MTTAEGLVFVGLCLIPAILTAALFITKERLLGFPCGIMWALLGGYSFGFSTATWDIFYLLGFGSLLGMVTFTIYSSFALREKRDAIADEEMEKGEGEFIDEGKSNEVDDEPRVSERTKKIRGRADKRRNR